ncbi:MAG: SNF2-related protein, partial [Thermodesulfovibrionales bacterium]|nr:SNF2-related protein [Thermodesulfovibrionales bacterium]
MESDQTNSMWIISEPADGIILCALEDVLCFFTNKSEFIETYIKEATPKTHLGQFLSSLISQLLELGLATMDGNRIIITYDDFVTFEEQGISAFEDLVQWSPFLVDIKSTGIPGYKNFRYEVRFLWGKQQVHLYRRGCFVKHLQKIFRLDRQMYSLLEAIDKFNKLPDIQKESTESYIHFAQIKGLSDGVGATIDSLMNKFRIVIPPSIGLDFFIDEEDRLTLLPRIEIPEISPESIYKTFIASDDPTDISIQTDDGGWTKVIFNEAQKEILRRIQKIRNVTGRERIDIFRNPQKIFEGVVGELDLSFFGERVKGIGDFPFIVQPFIKKTPTGIFEDPYIDSTVEKSISKNLNVGVKCVYADGKEEDVTFKSRDELLAFYNSVKKALEKGEESVQLDEKIILVDHDLVNSLDAVVERVLHKPSKKHEKESSRLYLLIYENEEEREYIEDRELKKLVTTEVELPKSLIEGINLKRHQKEGLKWLQHNYLLKRSGCLLADDMGLGKTLQILTFLAWLIEKGEISSDGRDKECAPWDPILIVAPVMLIENETWINDMKKFFKNDGAIFTPYVILHGSELKKLRKTEAIGTETQMGTSLLDIDRLRQYRVVITNYETVVNYQFSFAMMKSRWSVVVTDEAQEYKTPKTKVSHALKSLSPRFRIAATGTPVETSLSDVWNIFDFLQPGSLLGSAKEFYNEFVKHYENGPENSVSVLTRLRKKLLFGSPNAYILRRDKTQELEGLPKKIIKKRYCNLSQQQREMHIDFIKRAKAGGEGNHPLRLIHKLMFLYQHPALVSNYQSFTKEKINDAFQQCPKLVELTKILEEIKNEREKAIIFTRSLDMQQLLASAIYHRFGIYPDIVNGSVPRKGNTLTSKETRKTILDRFRESEGFNVIILSPDVAGIGITLIEANHVIHYGRWWNPAKESQATDRVYRIGQSKNVYVYYIIAQDPEGLFKTFDEKLDSLIESRMQMASDFLAPMPSEDDLGKELYEELIQSENISNIKTKKVSNEDVRMLTWNLFEALIALIEEKQGNKVILTPLTNDYGIDVISLQGKTLKLIQCKH